MYHPEDTIAAIASASGGAARGIVRISGPATGTILSGCIHVPLDRQLQSAREPTTTDGTVELPNAKVELPVTVYYWPDSRSYTRQPAAEIHTIGSAPFVSSVIDAVCLAGARLAEPGEFTLRAFLAGRLDLTQAEAVLGVIDARGDDELRVALDQLAGGLANPLHRLRESLLELLAHLEAGLDFVEEDIEFVSRQTISEQLEVALESLHSTFRQLQTRRRTDALPRVALVGWPNVGKSTLFNALAANTAALVSNEAGTTRDYVTTALNVDGLGCQLIDTAGHDATAMEDSVQFSAQQLSAVAAENCDIELLCLDCSRPPNAWEESRMATPPVGTRLIVFTKCDLESGVSEAVENRQYTALEVSAATGAGVGQLRRELGSRLGDLVHRHLATFLTAERCAGSLRAACDALEQARKLNANKTGEELIAAELRIALTELGKVVGAVYTDDILDRVFSRFCIGK